MMDMKKFFLYYSGISTIIYVSASVVFFSVYENIQGGLWAGAAAFVAAKCFILHCLHLSNKLYLYYKQEQMKRLTTASFVIVLIASTFLIWYIFTMVYWKIPILEYKRTPLFSLVFCFITGKWALHMHGVSKEYAGHLSEDYSPITQTV